MQRTDGRGVAVAFANKRAATNSNRQFYTSGDARVVYSYGEHWPIAAWINGEVVMHKERRSVTTSKHTSFVRAACAYSGVPVRFVETRRELSKEAAEAGDFVNSL